MFVGLCWNSHVGHLEARQQHYAAVCGLLLSERHHHSLRPGVRLTPEFILLHLPGAIATCSLSLPWCQIMSGGWVICEAAVQDELLLEIIWMHLRKEVCLLNFRADFFFILTWCIYTCNRFSNYIGVNHYCEKMTILTYLTGFFALCIPVLPHLFLVLLFCYLYLPISIVILLFWLLFCRMC